MRWRCYHEAQIILNMFGCSYMFITCSCINTSFDLKGAFVLGENDFRKSFSPKSACLSVTENDIFRKMTSGWPIFSPLTRKWFCTLIFPLNHFRKKRERERERRESKERAQITPLVRRSHRTDKWHDRRDCAARSSIDRCDRRARSSDAHRLSARSKNWLHFFCWVLVSFAWFDAFSVKIFEWTNLNLLVLF